MKVKQIRIIILFSIISMTLKLNGQNKFDYKFKKITSDLSSVTLYFGENEAEIISFINNNLDENIYVFFDNIEYINLTDKKSIDTILSVTTPFTNKFILTHKPYRDDLRFKYNNNKIRIDSFPSYQRNINKKEYAKFNKDTAKVFVPMFKENITIEQDSNYIVKHRTHHHCYGKLIRYYFKESDIPKIEEKLGIKIEKDLGIKIRKEYGKNNKLAIPEFHFHTKKHQDVFRLAGPSEEIKNKENIEKVFDKYIHKIEQTLQIFVFDKRPDFEKE